MAHLTAEMKAQLMKVTGITDTAEFDKLVKQHVPHIENSDQLFEKHSPFDISLVMFKEQVEQQGMKEFRALASLEEKMEHVYNILIKDPDFRDVTKLSDTLAKGEKDIERSKRSRDLGNKNFQKRVYEEAIRYYSEAVMLGPIVGGYGKEAALALGNRSVVLFQLAEWEACLEDCAGALELGYPADLSYKVHERRGRCHAALGRGAEARASFRAAEEAVGGAKLEGERRAEVVQELRTAGEGAGEEARPVALLAAADWLRVSSPHSQFPSMSDSLSMQYSPEAGRHTIATRQINPGDVILVEEPLAWTISVKSFPTICQNCARDVGRTPFPSPTHPTAVYCTHSCLVQYRQRLGPLDSLALLELFGAASTEITNSVILAFRAVIQQPLSFFLESRQRLFTEYDKEYGTREPVDWRLDGRDNIYRCLFNFVNYMDRLESGKELDCVIKTTVLLRHLICGGYFGPPGPPGLLTADQAFIGRLLATFHCGINYNQHGIYQAVGAIEAGKKLSMVDVGTAFYLNMASGFNHSCCPNTLRINRGRSSYMVAKSTILPGQEVTDCYGPHHLSSPLKERQALIQTAFLFTCTCRACEEGWPLLHELEARLGPADTARLGTLLSKYQTNFREHRVSEALACCRQYLERLQELQVRQPHRNYEVAGIALSSCIWSQLQ